LSDSVYFIDAATLERRGAVAVGHRPYTAVAGGNSLYVSDWGDSTVSVIDLSVSPPVRRSALFVGPHPSALALRGSELFVALAGANGVARVDLTTVQVREQLTVALAPHAPPGSDPNALAFSPDGRTLYVAMAGSNAVAVVRLGAKGMRVAGLIPAGWYPSAVAASADGRTLYVANGKGNGSGANPDGTYIGNVISGSVSIIPVPDSAGLRRYTSQVYALSPFSNARLGAALRPSARAQARGLYHPGEPDLRSGVRRCRPRQRGRAPGDLRQRGDAQRPRDRRSLGVVRQLLRERRGVGRRPRVDRPGVRE